MATPKNKSKAAKPKNPQNDYRKNADLIDTIEKEANEAARETYRQAARQYPELKDEFIFKASNKVFKRAAIPFGKICERIVDALLYENGVEMTQKAIIEGINKDFPEGKISPNVWSRKLEPWAFKKVEARIRGGMRDPVDISGCKTLSDIKKVMKAQKPVDVLAYRYTGTITISSEKVVAGRKIYPIMDRKGNPAIQILDDNNKRQWLRADVLIGLLENLKVKRIEAKD